MRQLSSDLAAQRQALKACQGSRAEERAEPGGSAGIPASLRTGEARLTPEDVEAIALRMASLLQEHAGARSAGGTTPSSRPEATPEPLSLEQEQALRRATALVDRVLSAGHMSVDEVAEIRQELLPLSFRPEAHELRRRLVVAINRRQLEPPSVPDFMP
jgi:hypothetical protein